MERFRRIFQATSPVVIGMIHVKPLPGSPNFRKNFDNIIDEACKESEIYKFCDVDGVLVENMHDIPYIQSKYMGPEVTASMTRICTEVRKILPSKIKCGVQVLAGGNNEAIAIAQAAGLQFIRAEGFVFSHVADEGFTDSCAGGLLRYRRNVGADDVLVFSDIKKKHCAHSITADVSIEETAKAAEFFLSDGVIITGTATGDPASMNELSTVKKSCSIPVLIGSGVTTENVENYLGADGFIVGSYFKKTGRWEGDLDKDKILKFLHKLKTLAS